MAEQQKRKAPAGWYPHPSMADTRRYWDGQAWTDKIAPAEKPVPKGPGVLTIARGVALGLVAVLAAIWFLHSCTRENDLDCATRNADRVQEGLPPVDCP